VLKTRKRGNLKKGNYLEITEKNPRKKVILRCLMFLMKEESSGMKLLRKKQEVKKFMRLLEAITSLN
jgi:hypothetical protein